MVNEKRIMLRCDDANPKSRLVLKHWGKSEPADVCNFHKNQIKEMTNLKLLELS